MRQSFRIPGRLLPAAFVATLCLTLSAQTAPASRGVQDPAWSPDGRRLAFSYLDQIWTANPDGRNARPLRPHAGYVERDPAWSPDGRSIALAVDTGSGFDIYVAPAEGGSVEPLVTMEGDERWPSWTGDGRIVFSHRGSEGVWRLYLIDAEGGEPALLFENAGLANEREPSVSPDGTRIVFVSDRESEDGDSDLWLAELPEAEEPVPAPVRLERARGLEAAPAWAPEGDRVAYYAVRDGVGSVWVMTVEEPDAATGDEPDGRAASTADAAPPVLVSRRGGAPAWSPDGRRIAIADLPDPEPPYNGNPLRNADVPPPLFAAGEAFRLRVVDAPLPVDSGAREIALARPSRAQLTAVFDRVWETLRRLYYHSGAAADEWERLKAKHRPKAAAAENEAQVEAAIDDMIAEQPLIKPVVTSTGAVVVSGHPLASRAGALALEKGGNVVDAAVATAFALGVVEPEASGIGGDGMAVLFLQRMSEPVVVDYKDQVPIHATRDNPRLRDMDGHGPAAANTPGVVAGLDHLYRKYGSGKISWADLIAPAIEYAENGFELDAALPTSIAEGRAFFRKYPAAAKIYLPDGKVPKPGERFRNPEYANTLRAIAKGGAESFYRGEIARRIADDMAANGGLITLDDLAQYRAIERRPVVGRYRGHTVYSSPPPVSTGAALVETLQILDNYRPRPGASYAGDADYLHYAIEAWKVRDQAPRIADPALWNVNLGSHLDPSHAASLFKRIDPGKASKRTVPPTPPSRPERIGRGTTAFAVADADGNMIAVTQTLSTWGGAFYVSEGLGFLYNNHLRFGRDAAPGRFLPLARSSSTSVPTLVFKGGSAGSGGEPWLAVAAAGNAWIPASVYGIILNVVDAGMPAQRAIEAPRFLVGRDPADRDESRIQIEDRFPRSVVQDLVARGHRFQKIGRKGEVRYGYAAAVVLDTRARRVEGGAEPRRSHAAVAVERGSDTR